MKIFRDDKQRDWIIDVNVATIRQVKALAEYDLLDTGDALPLERLAGDPVLLCDVLYALCKEQADALGVSDIEFGRAMRGDAIERATEALLADLIDFFPTRRRLILTQVAAKMQAIQDKTLELAAQQVSDPALDDQIAAAVSRTTGPISSGITPALSALTPAA